MTEKLIVAMLTRACWGLYCAGMVWLVAWFANPNLDSGVIWLIGFSIGLITYQMPTGEKR